MQVVMERIEVSISNNRNPKECGCLCCASVMGRYYYTKLHRTVVVRCTKRITAVKQDVTRYPKNVIDKSPCDTIILSHRQNTETLTCVITQKFDNHTHINKECDADHLRQTKSTPSICLLLTHFLSAENGC